MASDRITDGFLEIDSVEMEVDDDFKFAFVSESTFTDFSFKCSFTFIILELPFKSLFMLILPCSSF